MALPAGELNNELAAYLTLAHHLKAVATTALANIDTVTTAQFEQVISAAIALKEARDALKSDAGGIAYYNWKLSGQIGWGGDIASEATALDSAWSSLRDAIVTHQVHLLNSRGLTLSGITSPLVSSDTNARDDLAAALGTLIAAI